MVDVKKLALEKVLAEYPIAHLLEGWFFRLDALAVDHWRAKATDLWDRRIVCHGRSEDVLLVCLSKAMSLPARE